MVYGSRIFYNSLGKYLLSKTNQLLDYVEVQLDEVSVSPLLEGHNQLTPSPDGLTPILRKNEASTSSFQRDEPSNSTLLRNESSTSVASEANESEDMTPTNSMILPRPDPDSTDGEEETLEDKTLRNCSCVNWHSCGTSRYSTTARVCSKGDQIRISTIHTLRSRSRPSSLVTDYYSSRPIVDSDCESGFSEASDCSARSNSSVTKRQKSVKFKLEPDVVVFKKDSNTELSHLKTVRFPSLFGSPKIKLLIHTKVPSKSLEDISVGTSGERKRSQLSRTVSSSNRHD